MQAPPQDVVHLPEVMVEQGAKRKVEHCPYGMALSEDKCLKLCYTHSDDWGDINNHAFLEVLTQKLRGLSKNVFSCLLVLDMDGSLVLPHIARNSIRTAHVCYTTKEVSLARQANPLPHHMRLYHVNRLPHQMVQRPINLFRCA